MGAFLIIVGLLVMDILAIADVRRTNINNGWAFVILIVILPVIGFSIWYMKKTLLFSSCRKIKNRNELKLNDLTKVNNHDMEICQFHILLDNCISEFKQTESYSMMISNNKFNMNDSETIVDNLVQSFDAIIEKLKAYLTSRECVVAILLSLGIGTQMISRLLFISDTTVRTYKTKIKTKLPENYYSSLFNF